jgi:heme/copper-type cytochrome/quinol oxidase subunit 3
MTDITPTAADSADLEARNQSTAGRLFVAADAFLFLGFLFAYLYLRTLNNNGMWNPHGQNPSGTMGIVVLVLVVVAAALLQVGAGRMASAGVAAFRAPAAAALAVGLVATVLAGSQVFRPGFSPSHAGGFGSVFIGFIAFYFVHLIGGVYWLETQIVQRPSEILRGSVPPCLLYWWFLAVVLAIFSVLFYLV